MTARIPVDVAGRCMLFDSEAAWLEARRGAAHPMPATDWSRVLGVAPESWGGPWQVYCERLEGAERSFSSSQVVDLARGRKWEARVLEDYQEATGRRVDWELRAFRCIVVHEFLRWCIVSPDAFVDEDGGAEAKTGRTDEHWGENGTVIERWSPGAEEFIPPHYAIQVYAALEVTGRAWWDVPVGIARSFDFPEVRVIRVMRDDTTQADLVDAVGEWRERHLVQGTPPAIDGSDACRSSLLRRFPRAGSRRVGSDAELVLGRRIAKLKRIRERAKDLLAVHEAELQVVIGDSCGLDFGTGKGKPSITWVRAGGRASLDEAALFAARPDLTPVLEQFRRAGKPYTFPKFNPSVGDFLARTRR